MPKTIQKEELELTHQAAASELTQLMRTQRPFSYLRLGDGELKWFIEIQAGNELSHHQKAYSNLAGAYTGSAYGVRGVKLQQYERLIRAYEQCSYVDLYDRFPYNQNNLPLLKLNFSENTRKESPETSQLLFKWIYYEFGKYIAGRKCLLVSAESPLLEKLYKDQRYRKLAERFWSFDSQPFFLRVRNDGRHYWEYLDEIKEDIRQAVISQDIDTVFLSLGTGAKILCYELAEELEICAFDWGSASRGLAYAGSPGYHAARSSHSPYFLRIPLEIYMKALMEAYPSITPADLISKAHAQLCLDLQRKKLADSTAADACDADSFDPIPENLQHFWKNYRYYQKHLLPLVRNDARAMELVRDFTRYRRVHRLGFDGHLFMSLVEIKKLLKHTVNGK